MTTITEKDKRKLLGIISLLPDENHDDLKTKLEKSQVVLETEIPETFVTMNSSFLFSIDGDKNSKEGKLVYHFDLELNPENISVFSPMGICLLGMDVNEIKSFLQNGCERKLKVHEVIYQPQKAQRG